MITLTTGVDILNGTAGNDIFIGDNTGGGPNQISVADTINGNGGIDTFKAYLPSSVTTVSSGSLPTLNGVANLYVNGTTLSSANLTGFTGLTGFTIDNNIETVTATNTITTSGQAVTLANYSPNVTGGAAVLAQVFTTAITSTTDVAANVTLSNIRNGSHLNGGVATTDTQTLDIAGIRMATLNLTSTGAGTQSNTVTLTNSAGTAALATLNVSGDKTLNLTEALTGLKTINASAATGNVNITKIGVAATAGFAFTGGSGNDSIKLAAGDLGILTSGAQINGGAGTDKVVTLDTTFAATDYAKLNQMVSVEVLGTGSAAVVDASQLTAIKSFSVEVDAVQTYSNMGTGSSVAVTVTHPTTALNIGGAVGVNDLALTIGTATSNGIAIGAAAGPVSLTIGQSIVALTSNGVNTTANSIPSLKNADNSVYTITGANDLTISAVSATVTGSKFDASALTGKIIITGNTTAFTAGSALGDVLIGGSAADTIKASVNGGSLTGGAGADLFDVSVAKGGMTSNFQTTTITDLTKTDMIKFDTGALTFVQTRVDLSGAATVGAALDILASGATLGVVKYGTYAGNTYIVEDNNAAATFTANDTMIKLNGVVDLSTSTFVGGTTNTLTFA